MARAISYVNPGLVRVTDELGATTELRFTADGSLQQVTDPLGRTSRWVYDANGRAVQTIAADNSVTKFSYDAAGRGGEPDQCPKPHRNLQLRGRL